MPSFVHTADVHLDTVFSARFTPAQAELRRKEVMTTFKDIVNKADTADFLFISGDLFDGHFVLSETKAFLKRCFAGIPNTHIFIAAGNHDPYASGSAYLSEDWGENVHIFGGKTEIFDFPELKTRIFGRSFTQNHQDDTLAEVFDTADGWCNILVIHGEVVADGGESRYNPIEKSVIKNSGLDYVALGHIHKYDGIQRLGGTYYAYPGIPEGRGFDEDGEKGYICGEVEDGRFSAEWIPACKRKFVHLDVDVSQSSDGLEILDKLREKISNTGEENIYKVELTGKLKSGIVNCETLRQQLSDRVFCIEIIDKTQPLYDIDELAKEPGLRGDFVREMLAEIADMQPDDKKIGYAALRLGIDAMEGAR